MIVLTYWLAYWRHGLDPMKDTKHVEIPIYRIRNIPTQHMIDNNLTRWSEGEGWNLTSSDPNSGLFLEDNGMPVSLDEPCHQTKTCSYRHARLLLATQINLASLIISFFATSAFFPFLALVLGAFERYWFCALLHFAHIAIHAD